MQKQTIGFIGVGLMGQGMARNLMKQGHPLWVMRHANPAPVESLCAEGAREAATPAELARNCEIIHLCLPNSVVIEEVMRGTDGILSAARPGLIVIDTSTAQPTSTEALARELAEKGCTLVDAPLGRTPKEAEAGTLDAMVGCDAATFDIVKPVIDCWAGNITHVGPAGAGHKMKLLMNFISMAYASIYAESTVLGAAVGLPPALVRDVIGSSRLSNGFFDTFMTYAVERDRDVHKFAIANAAKDLRYVNEMATSAGVMNIMASAARHYFAHVEAKGAGADYVPTLTDHVGLLNGLDMEAEAKKGKS